MDATEVLGRMLGMPKGEAEAFVIASTPAEVEAISTVGVGPAEALPPGETRGDLLRQVLDIRADRIAAEEAARKAAEEAAKKKAEEVNG
jgi:hypothetical protein